MPAWFQKLSMIGGLIATGVSTFSSLIPAKYAPIVTVVGAIASTLGGLYHPAPGSAA